MSLSYLTAIIVLRCVLDNFTLSTCTLCISRYYRNQDEPCTSYLLTRPQTLSSLSCPAAVRPPFPRPLPSSTAAAPPSSSSSTPAPPSRSGRERRPCCCMVAGATLDRSRSSTTDKNKMAQLGKLAGLVSPPYFSVGGERPCEPLWATSSKPICSSFLFSIRFDFFPNLVSFCDLLMFIFTNYDGDQFSCSRCILFHFFLFRLFFVTQSGDLLFHSSLSILGS